LPTAKNIVVVHCLLEGYRGGIRRIFSHYLSKFKYRDASFSGGVQRGIFVGYLYIICPNLNRLDRLIVFWRGAKGQVGAERTELRLRKMIISRYIL